MTLEIKRSIYKRKLVAGVPQNFFLGVLISVIVFVALENYLVAILAIVLYGMTSRLTKKDSFAVEVYLSYFGEKKIYV